MTGKLLFPGGWRIAEYLPCKIKDIKGCSVSIYKLDLVGGVGDGPSSRHRWTLLDFSCVPGRGLIMMQGAIGTQGRYLLVTKHLTCLAVWQMSERSEVAVSPGPLCQYLSVTWSLLGHSYLRWWHRALSWKKVLSQWCDQRCHYLGHFISYLYCALSTSPLSKLDTAPLQAAMSVAVTVLPKLSS